MSPNSFSSRTTVSNLKRISRRDFTRTASEPPKIKRRIHQNFHNKGAGAFERIAIQEKQKDPSAARREKESDEKSRARALCRVYFRNFNEQRPPHNSAAVGGVRPLEKGIKLSPTRSLSAGRGGKPVFLSGPRAD